jgi:molecular chaperone DnaJ
VATTERDYYEVLGVSRDASDAELKRAFRRLARELHPDVSSEPDADHRFRELAEAYEVLSDPERRATYDRYGHAGLRSGGFRPTFVDFGSLSDLFSAFFGDDFGVTGRAPGSAMRGGDLQAVVELDLEEAFTGASFSIPVEVAAACERCGGKGAEPGTGTRTCPTCHGAGVVRRVSQNVFGQFVQQRTCSECGGSGEVLEDPCRECGGEGRTRVRRQLEVDVPAGIHDGQSIRVRGQGHAGVRGGELGNALVTVRVRPDPRFVRDGDDLHTAVRVTMTDAALGASVRVPALGGDVELEIPPGTQPGEVRVLSGRGMPSLRSSRRGNLYVRLDVAVPRKLTEEQRRLLEELAERTGPEAYEEEEGAGEGEGFLRRLRDALR